MPPLPQQNAMETTELVEFFWVNFSSQQISEGKFFQQKIPWCAGFGFVFFPSFPPYFFGFLKAGNV